MFDIWGDYGHFKKFHTTASPLTFSFPPPTAVLGLVGAILGMDKEKYWGNFSEQNTRIAVSIINPIKKVRFGINVIDTKSAGPMMNRIKQRSQIKYEYVKDAHYRICIHHNNDALMNRLCNMLYAHQTIYTLSLGSAQMLADFSLIGRYTAKEVSSSNGDFFKVNSVIPLPQNEKYLKAFRFEEGRHITKEIVSTRMTIERQVINYKKVLIDMEGFPITSNLPGIYKVGDDHVMFM